MPSLVLFWFFFSWLRFFFFSKVNHFIKLFCPVCARQVPLHKKTTCIYYLAIALFCFSLLQVACVGGQEDGSLDGCVPGFQVKHYHLPYNGPFQKGQALLQGQVTGMEKRRETPPSRNLCENVIFIVLLWLLFCHTIHIFVVESKKTACVYQPLHVCVHLS